MINAGANILFKTLDQVTKSHTKLNYESVRNIKRSLQSDLEGFEAQLAKYDADIAKLNDEIKALSILKHGRKVELQKKIDSINVERDKMNQTILDCKQRINYVTDIIEPINEKVEQYSSNLYRIVKKFEFVIK